MVRSYNQVGLDINIGIHPYHSNTNNSGLFLVFDISARSEQQGIDILGSVTGGDRISIGPIVSVYWNNVMARLDYKIPLYENVKQTQFSRGKEISLGIGFTF